MLGGRRNRRTQTAYELARRAADKETRSGLVDRKGGGSQRPAAAP